MNKNKYFIIKADDLTYNHLSKNWVTFLNILNKHNIPVALGLIGKSLEGNKGEEYNRRFKELISNHEIFCHGYLHCLNEYTDRNLEDQRNSILKSIEIIKKTLNYSPCTFGAPGNNISKNTKKALECTSINIWLFGMEWKCVNLNQRNFEFEYSDLNKARFKNRWLRRFEIKTSFLLNKKVPGNCDFSELIQRYKNVFNTQLIMGQIHPSSWSFKDLKELEKFLCFVINEGEHQFITPKQLVEKSKH
jgi:peptidoglycan/xylan/chitin deacetylase (PgdA/CDA1 family)